MVCVAVPNVAAMPVRLAGAEWVPSSSFSTAQLTYSARETACTASRPARGDTKVSCESSGSPRVRLSEFVEMCTQ